MRQVPVFYPNEEEFSDFYQYLTSIEHEVQPYGLCKIVPPPSWAPRKSGYDNFEIDIPTPIRQYVQGSQGVYQIINVMEKKMTFEQFKQEATLQEERGLKAAKRRKKEDDKEDEFDEIEELERMYWKNLTFHAPLYGADMLGSLFEEEEGKTSSWNLNHLDSLLKQKLPTDLPGVTKPYLYFGMWKAMFGCHTEDMELFSINYLHFGKPKVWYCAPPSQKEKFERLAQTHYPHHFKDCAQFLRHKSSMLSPTILRSASISLTHAVQRAGEFMITFPGAYHFGFNIGLNCAESVNFALESWVPHGIKAKPCQCITDSVTIDMKCFDPTWTPPPPPSSRARKHTKSIEAGVASGASGPAPPTQNMKTNAKAKASTRKKTRKQRRKKEAKAQDQVNKQQQQQQQGTVEKESQEAKAEGTRRTSRKTAGVGGVVARAEALEAAEELASTKNVRKRTAKLPKKTSPEKKRKVVRQVAATGPANQSEAATTETNIIAQPSSLPKRIRLVHKAAPMEMDAPVTQTLPTLPPMTNRVEITNIPRKDVTEYRPKVSAPWKFSCLCGERVVQQDPPHLHPKGLVFECSQCQTWGHVNCYDNFADKIVDELPVVMLCHMCRVRQHIQLTKNGPTALSSNSNAPARLARKLGPTIELLHVGPVAAAAPASYHHYSVTSYDSIAPPPAPMYSPFSSNSTMRVLPSASSQSAGSYSVNAPPPTNGQQETHFHLAIPPYPPSTISNTLSQPSQTPPPRTSATTQKNHLYPLQPMIQDPRTSYPPLPYAPMGRPQTSHFNYSNTQSSAGPVPRNGASLITTTTTTTTLTSGPSTSLPPPAQMPHPAYPPAMYGMTDSEQAQQRASRGRYMCGKCGQPKKGHVCPYADGEEQPKPQKKPPAPRNAASGQPKQPVDPRWHPSEHIQANGGPGQSVLQQQQTQLQNIKQRLQHLQQLQEQNKRTQVYTPSSNSHLTNPTGYAVQHFTVPNPQIGVPSMTQTTIPPPSQTRSHLPVQPCTQQHAGSPLNGPTLASYTPPLPNYV